MTDKYRTAKYRTCKYRTFQYRIQDKGKVKREVQELGSKIILTVNPKQGCRTL